MLKWIIFFTLLISGSILGYLYHNIKAMENNPDAIPAVEEVNAIRMLHSYKNGSHRYVGSIKLPNSCHEVKAVIVRDQKLTDIFEMRITTKDLQMQTAFCSELSSRYQFSIDEEGPEQVTLTVKLNGKQNAFKLIESSAATTDLTNQS